MNTAVGLRAPCPNASRTSRHNTNDRDRWYMDHFSHTRTIAFDGLFPRRLLRRRRAREAQAGQSLHGKTQTELLAGVFGNRMLDLIN